MDKNIWMRMDKIEMVMLADGWHLVEPGTFDVGEYGFVESRNGLSDAEGTVVGMPHPDAQDRLWVKWTDRDGTEIAASLASVRAIRLKATAS